jgi:Tfp pilus assembly protein PilF
LSLANAVLSTWASAASPPAAESDDRRACSGQGDKTVPACTRLIISGQLSGHELAVAYLNRAVAYHNIADYDHALQDYDAAIQADPSYALAFLIERSLAPKYAITTAQ